MGKLVGSVDGGKGMGLGNRGGGIGGSMSRSMSGRAQRGPGSMTEGITMGPRSVGGRATVVPETMAGGADEFGGTGSFKLRDLGSLRGPDMGIYSESITQSIGSGVSKLGGQHLLGWGGGGL